MKVVSDCVAVCSGELLSVTSTVKLNAPDAFGVPVIAPVDVFRLRPAGSVPELMEKLKGAAPPTAMQDPV